MSSTHLLNLRKADVMKSAYTVAAAAILGVASALAFPASVHNETVKFVTPSGREFRWRFDTQRSVDVFPLVRITPADIPLASHVAVYVTGDPPGDRS